MCTAASGGCALSCAAASVLLVVGQEAMPAAAADVKPLSCGCGTDDVGSSAGRPPAVGDMAELLPAGSIRGLVAGTGRGGERALLLLLLLTAATPFVIDAWITCACGLCSSSDSSCGGRVGVCLALRVRSKASFWCIGGGVDMATLGMLGTLLLALRSAALGTSKRDTCGSVSAGGASMRCV